MEFITNSNDRRYRIFSYKSHNHMFSMRCELFVRWCWTIVTSLSRRIFFNELDYSFTWDWFFLIIWRTNYSSLSSCQSSDKVLSNIIWHSYDHIWHRSLHLFTPLTFISMYFDTMTALSFLSKRCNFFMLHSLLYQYVFIVVIHTKTRKIGPINENRMTYRHRSTKINFTFRKNVVRK